MLQVVETKLKIEDMDETHLIEVLTDRVVKRKEACFDAKPRLMPERSRLFRTSWQQTESAPTQVRFAKAFQNIMENIPITIREDELITGATATEIRGCHATPEWYAGTFLQELQKGHQTIDDYSIEEETRQSILEDAKYWDGKTVVDKTLYAVRGIWGDLIDTFTNDRVWTSYWPRAMVASNVDYEKIMQIGLTGLIEEIKAEMAKIKDYTPEEQKRLDFMSAGLICCEAMITYAQRHAQLAREMAENEKDSKRKSELNEIADICERVPAFPARDLKEALQSYWFLMLGVELECAGMVPMVGRWDQFFISYFRRDLAENVISINEAAQLFAMLFIKFNELEDFRDKSDRDCVESTHGANMTLGGVTPKGKDAVNELSYLLLEVYGVLQLPQPNLSIQVYNVTSEDFLIKALETTREHGGGSPQYLNGDLAVLNLVEKGVMLEDARQWAALGCIEHFVYNKSWYMVNIHLNMAKALELALNNGIDPATGKQVGLQTGHAFDYTSYEQFYNAYKEQLSYLLNVMTRASNIHTVIRKQYRSPFTSLTFNDCMQKGLDKTEGGMRYFAGECFVCPNGQQNAADSLTAIKKVVFDDRTISMAELSEALNSNFEIRHDIQKMLLAAPKYGNDDDYADDIMSQLWDDTLDIIYAQPDVWGDRPMWGNHWGVSRQGFTWHMYFGEIVGALPDGRNAGVALADGSVSAMRGADKNGLLALVRSANKMEQVKTWSATFNIKLTATVVKDRGALTRLASLIRTYYNLGGYHMQFNMIDRETLIKAKENPGEYRNLLVRVAAYTARFVDLSPGVQDEIIERTWYEAV